MKLAKLCLAASAVYLTATLAGTVGFSWLVPQPELVRTSLFESPKDAPEQVAYRQKAELAATVEQFGAQCAAAGIGMATMWVAAAVIGSTVRRIGRAIRFLSRRPRGLEDGP